MSNSTYIYALPNATDSQGIFELFGYVNNVSDGLFFPIIFLVIYVIALITMLSISSAGKAFTFASFFITMLAIPAAVMGFLAPKYMYLAILSLAGGVLWLVLESRN